MNIVLQGILIAGAVGFLLFVVLLVKRNKLQIKYSLIWLMLSFSYLVIAIFPGIVEYVAVLLHIKEKVNALFLITIFFVLVLCFIYNLILSKQSRQIRNMIQEISILKSELQKSNISNVSLERGLDTDE